MNRSIRNVSVFTFVLVIILLVNLTWIQGFQTSRYAENSLNARQYYEMKSIPRGQISAGGQILAQSEADENDFYFRDYPTAPASYGAVLGYLSDRYGASGIEASQNSILDGTDDSLFATRAWDTLTGKERRGANVELTLQPNVQQVAYDELSSRGYSGSVVALRPSTGEVLAMASTPSFDPSVVGSSDAATADAAFEELQASPDAPLLNRSTQQTQPPGSTFKLITTAAALAEGDTADTMVTGESEITLPDTTTTLENYDGTSCGASQVPLRTAFEKSCNTSFVDLVNRHGEESFRATADAFGIGAEDDEDFGLPIQNSTIGDIPDSAALSQSAIGQRDVALTPLQNAVIAASIANDGVRMKPHIVKQVTGQDLNVIQETRPEEAGRAIDSDVASQLTELMEGAEQYAGGQSNIASKTGTAEHGEDSRNSNPHAWYVAFDPDEDADIAVAVLVENGGDAGQAATGGSVAAPIGRAVINAALQEAQ
ncbi:MULTISPECIES: peptidoglycan D,D-transpeptidase FtsI family protein [unclassified Corynebacterium]|uniref:peptidoglycan D,D-transpeptidase FtsI family protein n=1 Tax=unclassified Corynebacterium TaxID=2624378 RepID=UPI002648F2FA|nr:penicillin-binding protein 2 [Corynebacterium sp.]MDN5720347.1 penicillin-binding protein 2 [Corynebacterium sp.]MDN6324231.1 penicillin-binding protein 2 [Corynebacterium sp.]